MQLDDIVCNVSIDGKPWIEFGGRVRSFTLFERMNYAVPACELVLEDTAGYISRDILLYEGAVLNVDWGSPVAEPYVMSLEFRVSGIIHINTGQSVAYAILGYMNVPKWLLGGTSKRYTGSSDAVMQMLADESGMRVFADPSPANDEQTWRCQAEARCVFARRIASHGFVSDTSVMAMAPTVRRRLPDSLLWAYYKDLNNVSSMPPEAIFTYGEPNIGRSPPIYPISSYHPRTTSGLYGMMKGYRQQIVDQNVISPPSDRSLDIKDRVNVRLKAPVLQHHQRLDGDAGSPRTRHGTVLTGNTHAMYNKAWYQNTRGIRIMTGVRMDVLVPVPTVAELMDPVEVRIANTEVGSAKSEHSVLSYDGKYIVTGRVTLIEGSTYMEKIMMARESTMV